MYRHPKEKKTIKKTSLNLTLNGNNKIHENSENHNKNSF